MDKYELTKNFIMKNGMKLFQIKAICDFGNVKSGDLGGWIQSKKNLSQSGDAWVGGDASVCDKASVCGKARVYGDASVYGDARVYGDASVCDKARVCGYARVYGDASVCGEMKLIIGNYFFEYSKNQFERYIYCSTGLLKNPKSNKFIAYKRVNSIDGKSFKSLYDAKFIYQIGKTIVEKNYCSDIMSSCSAGIHVSRADYWDEGDTLIAVEFKIDDIITCMAGKLRLKRCKVLGKIDCI